VLCNSDIICPSPGVLMNNDHCCATQLLGIDGGFICGQSYSCNREHAMIIAQTSGAIRFLVHILQLDYCPGNDPCKVSAAFAMQNLAYHCSTTRERIAQAGAIPVLIQLLQSLDDSVREASAGVGAKTWVSRSGVKQCETV
jgi:hypothetical protein